MSSININDQDLLKLWTRGGYKINNQLLDSIMKKLRLKKYLDQVILEINFTLNLEIEDNQNLYNFRERIDKVKIK